MNQIYNVIYVLTEAEDFQNPIIDTKSFDTMERAEAYLKKQYESMLEEIKDGADEREIIVSENWGNNAEISLGWDDCIEIKHSWRVYTDTVNFEGI